MPGLSLVPSLRVPPGKKQSGERSRISWACSPAHYSLLVDMQLPNCLTLCLHQYIVSVPDPKTNSSADTGSDIPAS